MNDRRNDFTGYLLVGGPLDGDFVSFPSSNVIRLQRAPRPGWADSSSTGNSLSIDDYVAEYFSGFRLYRHKSITFAQAVNRLLLWYLPPETRPSLDATAVIEMAKKLEAEERPTPVGLPCSHEFEPALRAQAMGETRREIVDRCSKCGTWRLP